MFQEVTNNYFFKNLILLKNSRFKIILHIKSLFKKIKSQLSFAVEVRISNEEPLTAVSLRGSFDNQACNYPFGFIQPEPWLKLQEGSIHKSGCGHCLSRGASVLHKVWPRGEDNTDFPSVAPQGGISCEQGLGRLPFRTHSARLTPCVPGRMSRWDALVWEHTKNIPCLDGRNSKGFL